LQVDDILFIEEVQFCDRPISLFGCAHIAHGTCGEIEHAIFEIGFYFIGILESTSSPATCLRIVIDDFLVSTCKVFGDITIGFQSFQPILSGLSVERKTIINVLGDQVYSHLNEFSFGDISFSTKFSGTDRTGRDWVSSHIGIVADIGDAIIIFCLIKHSSEIVDIAKILAWKLHKLAPEGICIRIHHILGRINAILTFYRI